MPCSACRMRRIKCDEVKPICKNCTKSRRDCQYQPPSPSQEPSPPQYGQSPPRVSPLESPAGSFDGMYSHDQMYIPHTPMSTMPMQHMSQAPMPHTMYQHQPMMWQTPSLASPIVEQPQFWPPANSMSYAQYQQTPQPYWNTDAHYPPFPPVVHQPLPSQPAGQAPMRAKFHPT